MNHQIGCYYDKSKLKSLNNKEYLIKIILNKKYSIRASILIMNVLSCL